MLLKGKRAVVTGASRGVGRAIAAAFLSEGAAVHGTGRDPEALADTEAALHEIGGEFALHEIELTSETAICTYVDDLPQIDILVNNAGIARITPFVETDVAEVRQILETNVVAPFVLMRQAARKMLSAGGGQIINIASDASVRGIPQMAPYTASKHALLGMGRALARELRKEGIRVTTYCPGPIDTHIVREGSNPEALRPADVARTIVHLAALPPEVEVREMLVEPMLMDIP
tara:strand:- start:238 stop:933 length:696 start_codon:yes stop_codon:yes gene_type:complete